MTTPYNPRAICPKCGAWRDLPPGDSIEHQTIYHERGEDCTKPCEGCGGMDLMLRRVFVAEHLHRRCGRCGYDWIEQVIG